MYDELTALDRPVMIAETGCAEEGGSKAAWLQQAFLEALPRRFPGRRGGRLVQRTPRGGLRLDSSAETLETARIVFEKNKMSVPLSRAPGRVVPGRTVPGPVVF